MRRNTEKKNTRKFNNRDRDNDDFPMMDKKGGIVRGRRRPAKYQIPKDAKIEYKNLALVQKFVTDRGKIVSRRVTGISGKEQRAMVIAIKRAQFLGLVSVGAAKRN